MATSQDPSPPYAPAGQFDSSVPYGQPNRSLDGPDSYHHPSNKLWTMYVNKANKYDDEMTGSWKDDMEGVLIFTGLFSATISTFLAESYQQLQPDPESQTVAVLSRISQQLAAANGSINFPLPSGANDLASDASFKVPRTAVWVNALWFISLVLNIKCALAATLIRQWARRYEQMAHHPSSNASVRARIRFYVAECVDGSLVSSALNTIPFILHVSVFLFLAGLVIFLSAINGTVMVVVLVYTLILVVAYAERTFKPIFLPDSPGVLYHTPMTTVFWHLRTKVAVFIAKCAGLFSCASERTTANRDPEAQARSVSSGVAATFPASLTMRVLEAARKAPITHKAFEWLFKHMDDDSDWEKFLEGLVPLVKSSATSLQETVQESTLKYVTSSTQLTAKVWHLLATCGASGGLSEHTRVRRSTTCLRTIWYLLHSHGAHEEKKGLELLRPQHVEEETTHVLKDLWDRVEDPVLSTAARCMAALADLWKQEVGQPNTLASPISPTGEKCQSKCTKLPIVTDFLSHVVSAQSTLSWPTHAHVVNRTLTLLTANSKDWPEPCQEERDGFLSIWEKLQGFSEKSSLSSPSTSGGAQSLAGYRGPSPPCSETDALVEILRPLHSKIMSGTPSSCSPGGVILIVEPSPSRATRP